MILHELRAQTVQLIDETVHVAARPTKACEVLKINVRSYHCWVEPDEVKADTRPDAERPMPSHTLTGTERQQVLNILNSPEFSSMPPSQVVPWLVDTSIYLCSERSSVGI